MATIYKRKDSKGWWASIKRPDGGRIRKSTGTESKVDAEAWARQFEADLWKQARLGVKPERTWREAVVRWLTERSGKAIIDDERYVLRWLHPHLHGRRLSAIDRSILVEIAATKKREGVSNRTANQHTNIIRSILRRAKDVWGWANDIPYYEPLPEPKRRVRFLTTEEAQALLVELPEHQRDIVIFALMTGLRQANVLGLTWSQVALDRRSAWVYGDQTKTGSDISVALNDTAVEVLARQRGKHPVFVFTYKGRAIKRVNGRAWRKALKRAGIENFRWHDLRHTFASWLAMKGASLVELQELGGWASSDMVRRYAHLSADHLTGVSKKLDTFLSRPDLKEAVNDV